MRTMYAKALQDVNKFSRADPDSVPIWAELHAWISQQGQLGDVGEQTFKFARKL
jgi:hypothetical protein